MSSARLLLAALVVAVSTCGGQPVLQANGARPVRSGPGLMATHRARAPISPAIPHSANDETSISVSISRSTTLFPRALSVAGNASNHGEFEIADRASQAD